MSRVDGWRGGTVVLRFQPPPVEACMRFSRTRLTDLVHRRHSASLASPERVWGRRFRSVLMSRAGTPRRRENRVGLPADAGAFLVVEAVESVWRRGLDLDGSRTVLGARGSDFRFPDRGP